MRVNEYKSLKEFINEYDVNCKSNVEHHRGIEFVYNNTYYRISWELMESQDLTIKADEMLGRYNVYIVKWKNGFGSEFSYELIGCYPNMNDLLKNCIIDNRKLCEVIMDDSIEIIGKD